MRKLIPFILLVAQVALAELPAQRLPEQDLTAFITAQSPTLWLDSTRGPAEIGPACHMRLNDTTGTSVGDIAGGCPSATLNVDASVVTTASAKVTRAFDFYVGSARHNIDLTANVINASGAFSFCAWYQDDGHGGSNYGRFFDSATTTNAWLGSDSTSGGVIFLAISSTGKSYILHDGTWRHICAIRDSDTSGRLFLNGAFQETITHAVSGAAVRYVGANDAGTMAGYWDGRLDDVRIYSRALSAGEVAAIWNGASGHEKEGTFQSGPNLVLNSAGTALYAWQSVVGSNHSFRQTTAANRPTLGVMGDRRAILFDTTNDVLGSALTTGDAFTSTAKTIFAVLQPTETASSEILCDAGLAEFRLVMDSGNQPQFLNYDSGGGDTTYYGGGGVYIYHTTVPNVTWARHDRTSITGSLNGKVTSNHVESFTTATTTGTLQLGNSASSGYSSKYIGELITFNKALSFDVIQTIELGLAKKWGISWHEATAKLNCDVWIRSKTPTLWLRSSDLSTVTKDGSNLVSAWASKYGAVTFTQTTDGNKPTWTASGINFTAANNNFLSATGTTLDTFFNSDAKTVIMYLMHTGASGGMPFETSGGVYFIPVANAAPTGYFRLRNWDGSGYDNIDSAAGSWTANSYVLVDATHDGVNLNLRLNGIASAAVASGATSVMTDPTMIIGGIAGASNRYDGVITEIILDDSVWSTADLSFARACLGRSYGISF